MADKYNGWTNYETWNVALWIDDDEGSYRHWQDRARELYTESEASAVFTRREQATCDLADELKSEITDNHPLSDEASMYSDLLGAALSEVNWHEIAEHKIGEEADEIDAEEAEAEALNLAADIEEAEAE